MSITLRYIKDRYRAEEVLNDSFIKVFKKIDSYDDKSSFKPWLSKIVVNTSLDHLRKYSKQVVFKELSSQDINHIDLESDDLEINCKELMKIIHDLPPQYKAVFNLYVFDGYKHKEIADLLKISESTSKSNYSRAKNFVRNQFRSKTLDKQLQIQSV